MQASISPSDILSIEVDEHTLCYQFIDPKPIKPNTPLLIFLHEGLGSIAQWKEFPAHLCATTGHQGLVYERYGYGNSTPLAESRVPYYLENEGLQVLPALLRELEITRPVILVGHSDGGSIALVAAATSPQVVGVITEAAHVFVEQISIDGIKDAVKFYESSDKLKNALTRYHGDHVESTFRGWSDLWLSDAFRKWNIEQYVLRIDCPVLAIQGEDDEYGTKKQVDSIVACSMKSAKGLMVPNCGHAPHHQQPEIVLKAMVEFISEISTKTTSSAQ